MRWILFILLVLFVIGTRSKIISRGANYLRGFTAVFFMMAMVRLASTLWSSDPAYTAMRGLSLVTMGILVCYFVGELRTRKQISILNYTLIAWLFFLIVPGLLLYSVGIKTAPFSEFEMERGWHARYSGILGNPNQIAICAAVLGPLVIASWLDSKKPWLIGLYLATIISVYLCGSRAGLLTQVLALITVPALASRKMSVGAWIVVVLVFALLNPIVLDEAKEYITRGKSGGLEEVASNRSSRWELGVESLKKRPLLGQGYGIGGVPKSERLSKTGVDRGYPLHNSYLQALQENGIIGTIPFLLILIMVLKVIVSRNGQITNELRYLHAGFASAFLCGCGSAFFESWMVSVGNLGTLPFWCACGVVVSISKRPGLRSRSQKRFHPRGASREVRTPGWTGSGQNAEGKQGRKSHRG